MSYNNGLGLRETYDAINEINTSINEKVKSRQEERLKEANELRDERDMIIESKEIYKEAMLGYRQAVSTKLLSDSFKAIYITALENVTDMSDTDYKLANNMVDKFIEEHGVYSLLREMKGKTYLLDTIRTIVEDGTEDAEEKADDEEKSMKEVPQDTKEDMFNKLEGEEDVNNAVQLISDRIAAAEEEFIKQNAEDKKKIEDIVNGINDRIQAVKNDVTKDEETKEDIEESYNIEKNRKITEIYDNRSHTLFDHMIHETAKNIFKDTDLKESYSDEGRLDLQKVVNSCKCMYGFLEFVNTLQIDKVDVAYIEKIVKDM